MLTQLRLLAVNSRVFDELKSHDFNIEGSVDDYTSIDNDVAKRNSI